MNKFILIILLFSFFKIDAQNLEKIRTVCSDEVNLANYNGELNTKQLKKQIAALGFRYIEDGQIKYHNELIVYDCNTGDVKFTAVFDENKLVKQFVLFEKKDVPAKKLLFTKNNESSYVNLKFKYKGQEIASYPIGKTEIFEGGKLKQTVVFAENGGLPLITNYDANLQKISEGTATISGYIQKDWEVQNIGEWKYYENGQLVSISNYDSNGKEIGNKFYENGTLIQEISYTPNGLKNISNYYANGKIKASGAKKNNYKIETWKYFNNAGNLKTEIEYANGIETVILAYGENNTLLKRSELISDKTELAKSLGELSVVYEAETYYPNKSLKSEGFESEGKKVGVYEYYDQDGELSKISEYNVDGDKINSLDANTYLKIQKKEKQIFRELLVAKVTHPGNLNQLERIEELTNTLNIDFDSLMVNYAYTEEYKNNYATLKNQTSLFGNLSNDLEWYDSLLTSAENFNNEVWAYSHDLFEIELALEKQNALNIIDEKISKLKENHTTIKKTLFGKKLVVMNEQDDVYNMVTDEIYTDVHTEISSAASKYSVRSIVEEFNRLVKKASNVISQPDEEFQELLKKTQSVRDKRQLFLTVK
ncbi:hypothetical protein [Marivirga sp.]|uniref:toxin-antitoxin system YwqK family antitoxin n=1 Tax=Marivirga sp. TaxID=2018662 RepID=UPI002D7F807A|nr:hypothetical protein [Marivirga sp.]HET8861495.1 hypothetical protein [Marivirga sp.]